MKRLMEGNARYVSGVTQRHDFAHEREALNDGQNPYAAVLSCADSRIAPEYAFDSARGDLFVTRVAGNFVNDDVLGSLEYAVAVLKIPMILVLGHDKCGAVDAALKVATKGATYPGRIQSLAIAIQPSVNKVKGKASDLLDAAIAQNVSDSVLNLPAQSAILREAQKAGALKIVGGVYRLRTGKIDFID
jgi:carbonic anhydrase